MLHNPVETVRVGDICQDVDGVAIYRDKPGYRAIPYADNGEFMEETLVDLREYPAVQTVVRRAADLDGKITWHTTTPDDIEPV